MKHSIGQPTQGLYDPAQEHDACGVGFVVDMKGRKSHQIVSNAMIILKNLVHRGACGAEENTGDGVGILIQKPHKFFRRVCGELGINLPEDPLQYGAGMVFLPRDPEQSLHCRRIFEQIVTEEGQTVLGWRDVPVDDSPIGPTAKAGEPNFKQIFIGRSTELRDASAFDRKLYVIRKRVEQSIRNSDLKEKALFYIPTLSYGTFVYKGMLT